jgi:hypothetical protein
VVTSYHGWVTIPFQGTLIDPEIVLCTHFQMESLVELQRKSAGVSENTFLVKREC